MNGLRRYGRDIGLAGLVAALFLTVSVLDKPVERDEVAMTTATVAAAQEYERVMELYGDSTAARVASDAVFEQTLGRLGKEGTAWR